MENLMHIYQQEPHGQVFFLIDNKSFYASVEAVMRGLNPLKTALVVMSEQENTNGGLILATSPKAKQLYHLQANVSRQRDLPQDPRLIVVPPRMNLYIKRNLQINNIFREFVADDDLVPYSIDESLLDLTHSWRLFGDTPVAVARRIQQEVRKRYGLYTTIGIGETPVQAKIALDVYAKHTPTLISQMTYATVPEMIWPIEDMTQVWSIAHRTAAHLHRMGIHNMYELAHFNPFKLTAEMGIIGGQLYALAWGIDRTKLSQRVKVKEASIGNSQVLPRDYRQQAEIETVIKEIGEQVGARLRHHHQQTAYLHLGIGFSYVASEEDGRGGFSQSIKVEPTNSNKEIVATLITLFRKNWEGQTIRNVAVYTSRLRADRGQQLSLFLTPTREIKNHAFEQVVDDIRARFGFKSLVYARSLTKGGTAINRASLVGGHNGGNAYD